MDHVLKTVHRMAPKLPVIIITANVDGNLAAEPPARPLACKRTSLRKLIADR